MVRPRLVTYLQRGQQSACAGYSLNIRALPDCRGNTVFHLAILMVGLFSFLVLTDPAWSQSLQALSNSALAELQQDMEDEEAYLPMEQFHTMSIELGLDHSDLRLRALFDPKARAALTEKNKNMTSPENEQAPRPRLAHIKKKGGGKPIITLQEVMMPHIQLLESKIDELIQTAHQNLKKDQKQPLEFFTLPELPRCLQSYTDKTELRPKVTGREKEVIGDVLFVTPTHTTTNAKEIFGESVELIVYDSSKPSAFGLVAKSYQVSCLPYRLRSTGTFLFKHYGEHALRNFNGDPHGVGEKIL